MELDDKVQGIDKATAKLQIKKGLLLKGALESDSPDDIFKAQSIIKQLETKQESNRKSLIVDPNDFAGSFGYKDKPVSISYGLLYNMSKTPIINAIIRTRINQVAAFAEPQKDKYSLGYTIRKRRIPGVEDIDKLSKEEEREIFELTEFIENCGDGFSYEGDQNFDSFIRKITRDSLTYDQMTFEPFFNKKGEPYGFGSVDASTIRVADSYDDETYNQEGKEIHQQHSVLLHGLNPAYDGVRTPVKGYYPSYVQIYQGQAIADFYPWELCFGVRNPITSIHSHGYGVSELEEMTTIVTSMLWGDEYNRRFFKQGSIPKGLLKVSGSIDDKKLQEFKQQWNATMRGVWNSWRTPIMEAEKVEWVDLQKSNRDMEYSNWAEYLIKIACAIYSIDPREVNFHTKGGSGAQSPIFSGGGNEKEGYSQSLNKGLYPILKFLQKKINRYILYPKSAGKYEFAWQGIDASSPEKEQEMDIKAVQSYTTVNEIRIARGMPEIEGGDIILNPAFVSNMQADKQAELFGGAGEGGEEFAAEEVEEVEAAEGVDVEKSLNKLLQNIEQNR